MRKAHEQAGQVPKAYTVNFTIECNVLIALLFRSSRKFSFLTELKSGRNKPLNIFLATLLGTNLAILLQQYVFHLLPVGIGVTLLSTTPIWALLLSHREEGQVKSLAVLSSCLAVLGVALAFS